MSKLIKPLKLLIDLKSITDKKITESSKNLLKHGASKGALGSIEVLSQTFDLYLLNKYSTIHRDELNRWLKAASIDKAFRKIIIIDDAKLLRDFILQNGINVTIATDIKIIDAVKDASIVYWLSDVHTKDIQVGISKVNSWYSILKDVIKYSTMEDYEFKYNKKKH